ncbi:hypothetical protein CB0940_04346 [Cercospora beticola]|uniref:Uncharacterized protein n=1 Tax=Cercospora beticola TaxID=122368 RepID=A0A2G5HK90_CERBT|nr:hypothetical protein CB0940_04346 [Cercospora beticola]PIA92976.1 hypothetical protein CB0940_04346 [Cercospora beticola]WPB01578.1 hypothetical protein RHO25_006207 [Cercospora beticola]
MCFQTFITFLCGCTRIDEGECYLAAQLDVNFWRKIDCADYSIEHAEEKVQCGAGMFYCGATSDGQFFDKIEKGHQQVKGKLFAIVAELEMRKRILLSKRDVWLAQGASHEHILALSEVKVLNSSLIIVDQQKKQYEHECNTWMKVKSLAKRHYDDQQVRKQQGYPRGPSFEVFLANFHPQVLAKVNESSDPSEVIDGQGFESVRQFPLELQIPSGPLHQASLLVPSAPHKQQMPRAPVQNASAIHRTHPTAQAMVSEQMRAQAQQRAVQNAIPEVRAHQQKLTRAKKQKVEPASSPGKSSSVVRRSSRVKDKKINYRDDNSDLSGSFSPIKAKSDSSGFSPGKSDPVHSPDKARTVGRKGSGLLHEHLISERKVSLADKIGDWRRHDSGIFLPNSASGDGAPQAMRGMKRQAEDEGMTSPGGTRFKRQSRSDQSMNKGGAVGDGMPPLQSQQMRASFNPMMMPDFHAAPLIKREFSDTADPVKRLNVLSTPTHYSQGGPVAGSTAAPAQNAMPAASTWFNPLAEKISDQASIPVASFAQVSPASVHDFALPHNSAIPQEAGFAYERDADEKQVVDFGLPFDAGSNMADNIYSDIDWSLLGEGDFSLPA